MGKVSIADSGDRWLGRREDRWGTVDDGLHRTQNGGGVVPLDAHTISGINKPPDDLHQLML